MTPVPRWGFYLGVEVGIRPILSPVALNIRQILKLTISLVLVAMLSACATGSPDNWRSEPTHNYYEPEILISSQYMIRIRYLDTGPNAQHEQVKQMMSDHCGGSYIETYRVHETGYTTVEAECTDGDS